MSAYIQSVEIAVSFYATQICVSYRYYFTFAAYFFEREYNCFIVPLWNFDYHRINIYCVLRKTFAFVLRNDIYSHSNH